MTDPQTEAPGVDPDLQLSRPVVSVIVPVFRDWEALDKCIKALAEQSYPACALEILVINNDPTDEPRELHLPENVRLLEESTPGSYAARNRGVREATGEIVAFTDADCRPYPSWIQQAVVRLRDGCERVAGRVELIFISDRLTSAECYEKLFAFNQIAHVRQGKAVTANLVTWRSAFEQVGLFNSDLLSGGDMEWGARATEFGLKICYEPDCVVEHPARSRFRDLLAKKRRVASSSYIISYRFNDPLFFVIARGMMPPFRRIGWVLLRSKIPRKSRVSVALMVYVLQLTETFYVARRLFRLCARSAR